MGYNISGIAVANNLHNNLKAIEKEIGFNLDFVEEVNFETASSNWKEDGVCDIYFGKEGTLIFLSHELSVEAYTIMDLPTLTFALSEGAMTFCFQYCEKGELLRSKGEAEGKEMRLEGKPLDLEYASSDTLWLIWTLIEQTFGQGFSEIDLNAKALRYKLKKKPIDNGLESDSLQTKVDPWKREFMIVMLFIKSTAWIIAVGMVLTLLSIFKIYDNYGFVLILFGVVGRRIAMRYLKKRLK